jgi:CheY-like chemotaxis protein
MSALSLAGLRVLIVEDDYVVADALRFLIESYAASVSAIAPSVQRALDALAAAPVDIAVLDINLHGASVVPLAEHLRTQGVPFVFLTGYGDAEVLPEHLRSQPRFYKPVQAEALVRGMIELVGRRA